MCYVLQAAPSRAKADAAGASTSAAARAGSAAKPPKPPTTPANGTPASTSKLSGTSSATNVNAFGGQTQAQALAAVGAIVRSQVQSSQIAAAHEAAIAQAHHAQRRQEAYAAKIVAMLQQHGLASPQVCPHQLSYLSIYWRVMIDAPMLHSTTCLACSDVHAYASTLRDSRASERVFSWSLLQVAPADNQLEGRSEQCTGQEEAVPVGVDMWASDAQPDSLEGAHAHLDFATSGHDGSADCDSTDQPVMDTGNGDIKPHLDSEPVKNTTLPCVLDARLSKCNLVPPGTQAQQPLKRSSSDATSCSSGSNCKQDEASKGSCVSEQAAGALSKHAATFAEGQAGVQEMQESLQVRKFMQMTFNLAMARCAACILVGFSFG